MLLQVSRPCGLRSSVTTRLLFMKHYCNNVKLVSELFQQNDVWISQDLLFKAMDMIAKHHGVTVYCEKKFIKCNCQGKDISSSEYLNGPLKSGRTFQFKLLSLET